LTIGSDENKNNKNMGINAKRPRIQVLNLNTKLNAQVQVDYLNKINPAPPTFELRESWGNWITGFVDGEGCFSVTILKDSTTD
jgi:hypothetical protein